MRYRFAIGVNFDEDHVTRAKHHSGERLDIDVVTDHDDGCLWELLQALLYQLTQRFRFLIRLTHVFKERTQRWINGDRTLF